MDEPDRHRSRLQALAGIAFLAASVTIIMFSGAGTTLTKARVDDYLNRFAAYVASSAALNGQRGQFEHGSVEFTGWGFDKKAEVENVSIEVSEKALLDTTKWLLSTAQMTIQSDPARLLHFNFFFPGPINIIQNSQLRAAMTFPTPLRYSFWEGRENTVPVNTHTVRFPASIAFDPPQSAGDTAHPGRVLITYKENPLFKVKVFTDSGARDVQYGFENLEISEDGEVHVALAGLSGKYHERLVGKNRIEGDYAWALTDLSVGSQNTNPDVYSILTEISYKGDRPSLNLRSFMPRFGAMEATITRLSLTSDDFRVLAKGTVATAVDDPLPFGQVDLDIDHPDKLLSSSLVPAHLRETLTAAMLKITGLPNIPSERISIPIRREKGGSFHIGHTTYEEVTAQIFKDVLRPPPPQTPSVLPPMPESDPPVILPPDPPKESE